MAAYLAAHDGVIDVAHAHVFGLSNGDVRGRLARGEWFAAARGGSRVPRRRRPHDRTTAARWHGMVTDLPGTITLSTPHRQRAPQWPVQVVATRRRFRPEALTEVRDLPTTRKPLTALMAAVSLPSGAQFLDRMLQTRVVSLDELARAVDDNAGITGMVAARSLLAVAASDSESAAERLFVRLLDNWGVSGWVQQHPIGGRWRLDFAWPEIRMGVEISGWASRRSWTRSTLGLSPRHGDDTRNCDISVRYER